MQQGKTSNPWQLLKNDAEKGPLSFNWNNYGHLANACPNNSSLADFINGNMSEGRTEGETDEDEDKDSDSEMKVNKLISCEGKVAGQHVTALTDTGANRSPVHSSLIPKVPTQG